jgi:alpha-glucosidase
MSLLYAPDREVLRVARGFREHRIPCDVVWVDIDYMDGYRSFTFDPQAFPPRAR